MGRASIAAMKPATGLHRYWNEQLELLRSMPQAVRDRQPEAIHGLRAAGRRTKATVRVYQPLLRQRASTEVIDALDWYNSVLGQARDAEVIHQIVVQELKSVRRARQVLTALDSERRRTAHLADKMLIGVRADRVVSLVAELVADPWLGEDAPSRKEVLACFDWAQRRVANTWQRGPSNGESLTDWQHRLRRRAKVARFAAEALSDVDPQFAAAATSYAKVSTVLGVVQDTAIINRTLRVWPKKTVGELMTRRSRLAEQALAELPEVLAAAVPARFLG